METAACDTILGVGNCYQDNSFAQICTNHITVEQYQIKMENRKNLIMNVYWI